MSGHRILDTALTTGVLSIILAASWLAPVVDTGSGISLVAIWFALIAVGMFALLRALNRKHDAGLLFG